MPSITPWATTKLMNFSSSQKNTSQTWSPVCLWPWSTVHFLIFCNICSSKSTLKDATRLPETAHLVEWDVGPGWNCRTLFICQGWPTSQRPRATFLTVLPQRATSYTLAHMKITPSFPHWHTYPYSTTFVVHTAHQHGNDRIFQAIYCHACYLAGLLVIL